MKSSRRATSPSGGYICRLGSSSMPLGLKSPFHILRLLFNALGAVLPLLLLHPSGNDGPPPPHWGVFAQRVTTIAGTPLISGSADGTGSAARFHFPSGITASPGGTYLLISDANFTIRKLMLSDNSVTTIAGLVGASGLTDGAASAARFYGPSDIAFAPTGLFAYISDTCLIRKLTMSGGDVTTYAGTYPWGYVDATRLSAKFNTTSGLALAGGVLYVGDRSVSVIRSVTAADNMVRTFAGTAYVIGFADGAPGVASFTNIQGLAFATKDAMLYVCDSTFGAGRIRKVNPSNGDTATVTSQPMSIAVGLLSFTNGDLYVAIAAARAIYKIPYSSTPSIRPVSAYMGTGADGTTDGGPGIAKFGQVRWIATIPNSDVIFVADSFSHTIRRIDPGTTTATASSTTTRTTTVTATGTTTTTTTPTETLTMSTATSTSSATDTTTNTATSTATTTMTPTLTPTSTETTSSTLTSTATATNTESSTSTFSTSTLTITGTSTSTGTDTLTGTNTSTSTSTGTSTHTSTSTNTGSLTSTTTNTVTATTAAPPTNTTVAMVTSTTLGVASALRKGESSVVVLTDVTPLRATVIVGGTTFVTAASLVSPAVATQAFRMTGALGTFDCLQDGAEADPPNIMKNPFGLVMGPSNLKNEEPPNITSRNNVTSTNEAMRVADHVSAARLAGLWAGAAVSSYLGVMGLTLINGIVGVVLFMATRDPMLAQAAEQCSEHRWAWLTLIARWPGCAVGPVAAMLGPALEASMTGVGVGSILNPTPPIVMLAISIVAALVLIVFVALKTMDRRSSCCSPLVAGRFCCRNGPLLDDGKVPPFPSELARIDGATAVAFSPSVTSRVVNQLQIFVRGEMEWEPRADVGEAPPLRHHYTCSPLYEDYRDGRTWFLCIDLAVGFVISIVGSVRSASIPVCLTMRLIVLVLCLLFVAAVVILRPCLKMIDTVQSVLTSGIAAVIVILALCDAKKSAEALAASGMILFAARLCLIGAMFIQRQFSQARRLRELQHKRGSHQTFLNSALLEDHEDVPRDQGDLILAVDDDDAVPMAQTDTAELPKNPLQLLDDEDTNTVDAPTRTTESDHREQRRRALLDFDGDANEAEENMRRPKRRVLLDVDDSAHTGESVTDDGSAHLERTGMFHDGRRLVLADTGMQNPIVQAYGAIAEDDDDPSAVPLHVGEPFHSANVDNAAMPRLPVWAASSGVISSRGMMKDTSAVGPGLQLPCASRRLTEAERRELL